MTEKTTMDTGKRQVMTARERVSIEIRPLSEVGMGRVYNEKQIAELTARELADAVPFEVLMTAVRIHWGRLAAGHSGRKRTCGHSGEYIEECPVCQRAKALKEQRSKRGEKDDS